MSTKEQTNNSFPPAFTSFPESLQEQMRNKLGVIDMKFASQCIVYPSTESEAVVQLHNQRLSKALTYINVRDPGPTVRKSICYQNKLEDGRIIVFFQQIDEQNLSEAVGKANSTLSGNITRIPVLG